MEDRKKRLADLAKKAGRTTAPAEAEDEGPAEQDKEATTREIKFRNYTPSDPSLETKKEDDKKREREEEEEGSAEPVKKKSALEEALIKAKKDLETSEIPSASGNNNADELTAMAPKKINWDLKRDIQPKLDKLEKRTQKAIVQLLRERLAREADAAAEDGEGQDELD